MHAGIAQLVECRFCTPEVAGSSPVTSSTPMKIRRLLRCSTLPDVSVFSSGWESVLSVYCCVHMPLSIKGDAFGEDGSNPSGVYV